MCRRPPIREPDASPKRTAAPISNRQLAPCCSPHASQLVERRKHGFQFYTHDGGQIRSDADVFFKGGKKTGESHADGVKTGRQLVGPGTSLGCWSRGRGWPPLPRLQKPTPRSRPSAACRSVAHHSSKLARDRLSLARPPESPRRTIPWRFRTRAPRIRSRSCFTLLYLPGVAFAAVLVFLRCFHRELCRARNGLTRKRVRSIHFQTVLPR